MKNHEGVEEILINAAAKQAAEIREKPAYTLNPYEREMKEDEHSGIELSGADLAYFKKVIVERARDLKEKIAVTQCSLESGNATNMRNTEDELNTLRAELTLVEDLDKKLFEKKETTDAV